MSSKRGKQKETVEEDFEAFVRHQLNSISDDLKEMKGTQNQQAKLRDIIENDLQLQSNIKNAHRIGPFKNDGTPKPILAKFLYRLERFKVIKKKRDLRDGVSDQDFIMASFISTVSYIRLEMFEQYTHLFMCYTLRNENRTFSTSGGVALY
ncbi:unnamed protein product, partial [Pocillopora meandrina]